MKRLVIIEDQTAIREMLVEILRLDKNYELVGESGDGQGALTLCLDVKQVERSVIRCGITRSEYLVEAEGKG